MNKRFFPKNKLMIDKTLKTNRNVSSKLVSCHDWFAPSLLFVVYRSYLCDQRLNYHWQPFPSCFMLFVGNVTNNAQFNA